MRPLRLRTLPCRAAGETNNEPLGLFSGKDSTTPDLVALQDCVFALDTVYGTTRRRAEGKKMAEVQGRGTGAGRAALNFERIYGTTVPAEEVARALADHFRAQEFEAQVYRTSENRTVMQARKESLWRQLLGVTYALTVVITPGEGQLSISLGGHEWVDAAVSGAIGLVAVPPVLLGTAYGIWKENQLDKEVWQVIDKAVTAGEPEMPASQ